MLSRLDKQPKKLPHFTYSSKRDGAHRTRGIRFSDSECKKVKVPAGLRDVPASEFVHKNFLDIARRRVDAGANATPASLTPLIERTFRYTWMLAIYKRDEPTREGRGEEMEKLAEAEQQLQGRLQGHASSLSPPRLHFGTGALIDSH